MKKLICLLFVSVAFVFIVPSCKKNDTPTPPYNGGKTPVTTATIGGGAYSSVTLTHTLVQGTYSFSTVAASGEALGFGLSNLSVNTHNLNLNDPNMVLGALNGYTYTNYYKNNGSITITSNDGTFISGSFKATLYNLSNAKDSINVVNGQFTNFQYQ